MVTAEINGNSEPDLRQLKTDLHQRLVDTIDFGRVTSTDADEFRRQITGITQHLSAQLSSQLSADDRQTLCQQVIDEIYGFGPLEPLMNDEAVTDILVNRFDRILVERSGQLQESEARFSDVDHLLRFVQTMVSRAGRHIDESSPIVDARLPDGSRLNAVIPPLSVGGPTISIRRFPAQQRQIEDLLRTGSLAPAMADFLILAVRGRMNLVFSGGSGAGKTTMLNGISRFVPKQERIVTIEETTELQLQSSDVVSLETRLPGPEGTGGVTQRDLLRNALRMRPDRIVLGEARGAEVLDMLQAMNSGHRGSMSTVHANDARQALERLELLIALSGVSIPSPVARQFVAQAVDIIVHLTRHADGVRRVTAISEATPLRNGEFEVRDIFVYRSGQGETDEQAGFFATGYEPSTLQTLAAAGVDVEQFRPLFVPRRLQLAASDSP
ncbi:MAG: CpaF family protein [Planctomycetaceae bacterium]|nr:CpaF family protein [Planctomycetaceae bacterium]